MTQTRDALRVLRIQSQPIDSAALLEAVADPSCGAASLFLGIVRDHHEGRSVEHLEYECYEAMAEAVLREVAGEILERWDARALGIIHRTGRLEIGEVAVAVAVATPHRKDSFEACQYGIDEIKVRAPIWKKETYAGGERWVENCGGCAEAAQKRRESAR